MKKTMLLGLMFAVLVAGAVQAIPFVVKPVSATASSEYPGRPASATLNTTGYDLYYGYAYEYVWDLGWSLSGVQRDDLLTGEPVPDPWPRHPQFLSVGGTTMWMATGTTAHIIFDLGQSYLVKSAHIWNYNESDYRATTDSATYWDTDRGMKDIVISLSNDPTFSSGVSTVNATLSYATGNGWYRGQDVSFGSTPIYARYVKIANTSNWGDPWYTGLAEVRFVADFPYAPTADQDGTYFVDADGNWSDSANWQSGIVAHGASKTASFVADLTATRTVTLDFVGMIGNLVFQDTANPTPQIGWQIVPNPSFCTLTLQSASKPIISVDTSAVMQVELRGTNGFEKQGDGVLVLDKESYYSGKTIISSGTVLSTQQHSLGIGGDSASGTEVMSGATLAVMDNAASNSAVEPLVLEGSGVGNLGALRMMTGAYDNYMAWNGNIVLLSDATIGVDAGARLRLQASITGSDTLTKVGSGTLELRWNSETFTGNTVISGGTVWMVAPWSLGPAQGLGGGTITVQNGATLLWDFPSGDYSRKMIVLNGNGVDGTGALKLVWYTGDEPKFIGWVGITVATDSLINVEGPYCGMYLGGLEGSGTLTKIGPWKLDLERENGNFAGAIVIKEGDLSIRHFNDALGLTTKGTTIYRGAYLTLATDEHVVQGMNYPEPLVLGGGASSNKVTMVKYNSTTTAITDTWSGPITLAQAPVNMAVGKASDGLKITGSISGIGNIEKTGAGVLELTANNSYSGVTEVSAGTLKLTGTTNKLPNDGVLKIASGAKVELGAGVNETVGALILNGVVQPAGTYNASNTPAYFVGSGNLIVSSSSVLNGQVVLNDWTKTPDGFVATVKMNNGISTTTYTALLDSNGQFTIATPGAGTYSVLVSVDGWLAKKQTGVAIAAGANSAPVFYLTNGDCSEDNKLTLSDFAILAADWSESGQDLAADLNGDGTVNMTDLLILTANWLAVGDSI